MSEQIYPTWLVFKSACEFAEQSEIAEEEGRLIDEVRLSMMAQLAAAMTLEGILNEIGQLKCPPSQWKQFERGNIVQKWLTLSELWKKESNASGSEPIDTLEQLRDTRNAVAHAKPIEQGDDIAVRRVDGSVHYQVSQEFIVNHGDNVFLGVGPALTRFSGSIAKNTVRRAFNVIRSLRERTEVDPPPWLDGLTAAHPWLLT